MRSFVSRMPLRIRLVAATTLLLVVGLAVSGTVAATTLRGYLVDRVDQQLAGAAPRFSGGPDFGSPPPDFDHGHDPSFGAPTEFYAIYLSATGALQAQRAADVGTTGAPSVPHLTRAQVVRRDGRPFTVRAAHDDSSWRMVALPRDDGGSVLVAQSLSDVDHTVGRLELLELVIGLSVVVLLAGVGYIVVRRTLRPLAEVETTAAAIAAGDLSQRVPEADHRTEVGRLGAALNGMLHQIERAFRIQQQSEASARRSEEQMRQFVADASHELRTPLTSIRGFSELYRQGAVSDEEDLRRVMRRIEDEAARMGVLVDDLLLLARLDQQRPLERRSVDLVALATDAAEDARVVAPGRDIHLEVEDSGPVVVTGDELRLRQVLGNLVGNALAHTPDGSSIWLRVGTRSDGDHPVAVLEVADAGPGLSAEEAARVFERFYRADPSRTRSQGGTGLGLSIVAGLAQAHGGDVELDTAPGAGARFRVVLPLAGADATVAG